MLASTDKGRAFLETFVGIPTAQFKSPQYLCKPCLKKLERGQSVVNDLQ